MGNIVKTAKCRFCGQMTQIEADEELTAAQAEEQATMTAQMRLSIRKRNRGKKRQCRTLLHCLERQQHRTRDAEREL